MIVQEMYFDSREDKSKCLKDTPTSKEAVKSM